MNLFDFLLEAGVALLKLALAGAVAGWVYYRYGHGGAAAFPLPALFLAVLAARPIARQVMHLAICLWQALRYLVYRDLQGRCYMFDEHVIRFFLDDEAVWVAECDVAALLHPPISDRERRALGPAYGPIPGTALVGLSEHGLARLLALRTAHRRPARQTVRFQHWLAHTALPNVRRLPSSAAHS